MYLKDLNQASLSCTAIIKDNKKKKIGTADIPEPDRYQNLIDSSFAQGQSALQISWQIF